MTPAEFKKKWSRYSGKETSAYQPSEPKPADSLRSKYWFAPSHRIGRVGIGQRWLMLLTVADGAARSLMRDMLFSETMPPKWSRA
jgi:hypothetical protein